MHEQRGLARRRRALERRRGDGHDHAAAVERLEHVAGRERARHRVELVTGLDQPRRVLGMQVRAERHDEDVGVQRTGVGLDAAGHRVDRAHRGVHEPHAGRRQVGVPVQDVVGAHLPEHDIELGEAEDEAFGPVDQGHLDVGPECRIERAGELESAEAGSEDQYAHQLNLVAT